MVGRPFSLLHYYSSTLVLYTMHAPELLSFVDLFHHQYELGEDSAQIDGAKLTVSGSLATPAGYLPNAIVYLLAHTYLPSSRALLAW